MGNDSPYHIAIEALALRLDYIAQWREKEVEKIITNAEDCSRSTLLRLEASAMAYRRCALEVRRIASGDIPVLPDEPWE